jgi:hypothetical protein
MAGVTPEVEVLHASPVNPARLRPPPRLYCRTCSPKETDATLRKEQVQIVYEIVCIVFGENRFRLSLPELLTVCKVSFGASVRARGHHARWRNSVESSRPLSSLPLAGRSLP